MLRHRLRIALLVLATTLAFQADSARAANEEQIQAAVNKAKAFLYSQQTPDGLWIYSGLRNEADNGGLTVIATYALLVSGESPQEPRLAKAIASVKKLQTDNVYVLGLRAQLWAYLGEGSEIKALENQDTAHLVSLIKSAAEAKGLFYYPKGAPEQYDHSISQFGVLGLWALAQEGAEVGGRVWDAIDSAWRKHQDHSGGWAYIINGAGDDADVTLSMTCAGVATLFITHDYAHAVDERGCNGNPYDANIDRGMKYIAEHFDHLYGGSPREMTFSLYAMYGIERIGMAAGYKYFGKFNWADSGAEFLVGHQNPDGSWGDPVMLLNQNLRNIPGTAFGLLFLSNARAPVVIQKLIYQSLPPGKKAPEANWWNQRPRDMFNLSHWMARQVESPLKWSIVGLDAPLGELHDAPVLYIAGGMPLSLSDADTDKLRQFVEQGGLIFCNADCNNKPFSDSVKKNFTKMFKRYEFRELPISHVIYTGQQFSASKWRGKPGLQGLSNGVRELVLLSDSDPSKVWQIPYQGNLKEFGLGADIIEYAAERTGLREKRHLWFPEPDPNIKTDRSLRIARLSYDGNWDPEPGGWQRMRAINHNIDKIDVTLDEVRLGDGKLDSAANRLATLTGTGAVKLSDAQRGELKKYVEGGGTLLIDAAGGSTEFASSMDTALRTTFGDAAKALDNPAPPDDPIYGENIRDVPLYRAYARRVIGGLKDPRLRVIKINNRNAVIFSHEDLSNGLLGSDVDGVVGYSPEAVSRMVGRIILQVMGS